MRPVNIEICSLKNVLSLTVIAVSLFHVFLAYSCYISLHTCIVGLAIQMSFCKMLEQFPTVHLNETAVAAELGKMKLNTKILALLSFIPLFEMAGALFINMKQWITVIDSRNFSSELATTVSFFICVWMVPILLSITVNITWENCILENFFEKWKEFSSTFTPQPASCKDLHTAPFQYQPQSWKQIS
jgi:hypothetical protein